MSLLISGATIIDGVSDQPLCGYSILIRNGRIEAILNDEEGSPKRNVEVIDANGKYVIPGMINANVHLFSEIHLENLARYEGHYEELITEAAQVALRNGMTTVFDTWGPRRFLMNVRDRINSGEVLGSRIFCAGNIIGMDGPFSQDFDFFANATGAASASFANVINAIWTENVGRHLMWMTPEQVANEVRSYIGKGIDFIKYASNDHWPGAFLAFSPRVQAAIVAEARLAKISAQAHTMSVEGLRAASEAGCSLVQHANVTGPTPIPEETLELMAGNGTAAVVFPTTVRSLEWSKKNVPDMEWTVWKAAHTNQCNLIRSGVRLLLGNDGAIMAPEMLNDPVFGKSGVSVPEEDNILRLATGHFVWFRAMEESGCSPIELLRAATRNVAEAYGKEKDLGTISAGKIADLVILDKSPLENAENYRTISMVIKDGVIVDRERLPTKAILTKGTQVHVEEQESYQPFLHTGVRFPMCPMCMHR